MADTFEDLGFAKLDMSRSERTGMPETVYCAGKSKEQLAGILKAFQGKNCSVLGTRCSPEQASFVEASGLDVEYDAVSKTVVLTGGKKNGTQRACCRLLRWNGRYSGCGRSGADGGVFRCRG